MMESTMPILSKGNDSCREMSADVSKTVDLAFVYLFVI